MSSYSSDSARLDPFGRMLFRLCRFVAVLGGLAICAAGTLTVVSVLGRYFFNAPIEGDFELVEISCAIGVFSFLPYCQLVRGNVIVDFFTGKAPPGVRAALDAVGAIIYTLIAGLLAWRLIVGGVEMHGTFEETVILEIPRWYGFLPIGFFMALLVAVTGYTAWCSLREATGHPTALPRSGHSG